MFVKSTAQRHTETSTFSFFLFLPGKCLEIYCWRQIGISYPCYSILNAYYYFISPTLLRRMKKWNSFLRLFFFFLIQFVNKSEEKIEKFFENGWSETHQSCRACRMGRAEVQADSEDRGRSWQTRAFSSDPSNRLTRPFVHHRHRKRRCRCYWNPRRCFGLEAIANPNAGVEGIHMRDENSINYARLVANEKNEKIYLRRYRKSRSTLQRLTQQWFLHL